MYQIATVLLAVPVCGLLLFLTKFYAARQAVWKLQKANLVSAVACKAFTRLKRNGNTDGTTMHSQCRNSSWLPVTFLRSRKL